MINSDLPAAIYSAEQCKQLDQRAIKTLDVTGYQLMTRAAQAALALIRQRWPQVRSISVWAGKGNNGGDALVVARLAHELRWRVQLIVSAADFGSELTGEAAEAWRDLPSAIVPRVWPDIGTIDGELIIDGLLGIGFKGSLREPLDTMIQTINQAPRPVLSLDLPSGLDADSGSVSSVAVNATLTLTFIANKLGWLIHEGISHSGERFWAGLGLPETLFDGFAPLARLTQRGELQTSLPKRHPLSHKGDHGLVAIVGGNEGMGGAVLLAAEAALRVGAGRVVIASKEIHRSAALARVPEAMFVAIDQVEQVDSLLAQATALIVGPGLGLDDWARALLNRALKVPKPKLFDADALNLIAETSIRPVEPYVFTPHPGEAARLLGINAQAVVSAPVKAASDLVLKYGSVQVVKGAGTLTAGAERIWVSDRGNPGMGTAGMGDLLSGIIGGLMAQGLEPEDAARLGVWVHGTAGDQVAKSGERGLIASDLLPELRGLVNPGIGSI